MEEGEESVLECLVDSDAKDIREACDVDDVDMVKM